MIGLAMRRPLYGGLHSFGSVCYANTRMPWAESVCAAILCRNEEVYSSSIDLSYKLIFVWSQLIVDTSYMVGSLARRSITTRF